MKTMLLKKRTPLKPPLVFRLRYSPSDFRRLPNSGDILQK